MLTDVPGIGRRKHNQVWGEWWSGASDWKQECGQRGQTGGHSHQRHFWATGEASNWRQVADRYDIWWGILSRMFQSVELSHQWLRGGTVHPWFTSLYCRVTKHCCGYKCLLLHSSSGVNKPWYSSMKPQREGMWKWGYLTYVCRTSCWRTASFSSPRWR